MVACAIGESEVEWVLVVVSQYNRPRRVRERRGGEEQAEGDGRAAVVAVPAIVVAASCCL